MKDFSTIVASRNAIVKKDVVFKWAKIKPQLLKL